MGSLVQWTRLKSKSENRSCRKRSGPGKAEEDVFAVHMPTAAGDANRRCSSGRRQSKDSHPSILMILADVTSLHSSLHKCRNPLQAVCVGQPHFKHGLFLGPGEFSLNPKGLWLQLAEPIG